MKKKQILKLLKSEFPPSKYQMGFFKALTRTKKNILINAVAGSGKTTTILQSLRLLPRNKSVIFLAFNNSIVDELRKKAPSHVSVTTLHSLGWRAILNSHQVANLDKNKAYGYCEKVLRFVVKKEDQPMKFKMYSDVIHLMRNTMNLENKDLISEAERHDLFLNEEDVKNIKMVWEIFKTDEVNFDFTDMVYFAATKRNVRISRYDYVYVDEVQDLNKAQQLLVEKLLHSKSRLIAVGDKAQAIYGFAGSDSRSFETFEKRKNTKVLPLSISYRCSKNVVRLAQNLNPDIEYFDKSPEGKVELNASIAQITSGDWVLCRNNKPLVVLCVHLISRGLKARIKGSGDFAKQVIKKLKGTKETMTKSAIKKLIKELENTYKELRKKGFDKPEMSPKYRNQNEILQVIYFLSSGTTTVAQIINKLERLFSSGGDVILSSMHKSKGLENKRIFIVCPELIPSKFAEQQWQKEQEKNLLYVAYTRAKMDLMICDDFEDEVIDFRAIARAEAKNYKTKKKNKPKSNKNEKISISSNS